MIVNVIRARAEIAESRNTPALSRVGDAARAVVRRHYHKHSDQEMCFGSYEVCGEHHNHTGPKDPYPCGGRSLLCRKSESSAEVNALHDAVLALAREALA